MTLRPYHVLAQIVLSGDPSLFRRLRESLWLYVALVLLADDDGVTRKSFADLSAYTGIQETTLRSWSGHLRKRGLIGIHRVTDRPTEDADLRAFHIHGLLKPARGNRELKRQVREEVVVGTNRETPAAPDPTMETSGRGEAPTEANADNRTAPETEALARAILEGLGEDEDRLDQYVSLVETTAPEALNRAFEQARRMPEEKIKKSRGALFIYLIKKYATNAANER